MIYTVTFNPSLDYIVRVDDFRIGRVNRTAEEIIYAGGKGINVSIVLKNLGFDSTALGFLAGFTGMEIQRLMECQGIHADFIHVQEGISRINLKLRSLESCSKEPCSKEPCSKDPSFREESEINGQGPKIGEEDIRKLYTKLDQLKDGDVLVLAGSIPPVMPESMYMDIMKYLEKKKLRIVVDATGELLVNVLPYHPFLVKPNNHELGEIFGVELEKRDEVVEYAKKLQEMGAGNVLVSMAGEGAVLVAENGAVFGSSAPKGTVVNSVGAGDSMVAGFLAGFMASGDYRNAFEMGLCAGSASAFSEKLATKEEVEAIRKSHTFEEKGE